MNQIHCVRCTYSELMHGRLRDACAKFVAPGSFEARELRKAAEKTAPVLSIVEDEEETTEVAPLTDAQLMAMREGAF